MVVISLGEFEVLATCGRPIAPLVPVALLRLSPVELTVGRRGAVYLLEVDVSEMSKEQAESAVRLLKSRIEGEVGAHVLYSVATRDKIYVMVKGSPFSWAMLLALLPMILMLVGVTVLGVSIWQIIASIPSWVWATLLMGLGLVIFGPPIGELIVRSVEKAKEKAEKRA